MITFQDLRTISVALEHGKEQVLCDYLNQFEGKNTLEKFKNILHHWDMDVSTNLNFGIGEKSLKIDLSYILSQFPEDLDSIIEIDKNDIHCIIDIPSEFDCNDSIPIYNILKYIDIMGVSLKLEDVSTEDRKTIINKLPANVYNLILEGIINDKSKIVKMDNPILSKIKLNFLTNEPYIFLRGLFTPYNSIYFRDILFHLSKRIDSSILLSSSIQDIEYYIEKYNEETKETQPQSI